MCDVSSIGISDPAGSVPAQPASESDGGKRVAVIDIGSNSVRFVVYDKLARTVVSMHNEKSICRIGRDIAHSGRLYDEGCELALSALRRYRMLAEKLEVGLTLAVATSAARDAENGPEFIANAEKALGGPIRVLSGEEEAKLAGEGVLAGIPDADGVAGDLGGGSLDMVRVRAGRTGKAVSLPFGPLRLSDLAGGDIEKARVLVDEEFAKLGAFWPVEGKQFYAVGGMWRALARVDIARENYALRVLQHYTMPSARALELCALLSRQGRKSLDLLTAVSKRRAELLPYGALVLQAVLSHMQCREVVVCGGGLREGLLFEKLSAESRALDPLIDYARQVNLRQSRSPALAEEMFNWSAPLFAGESAGMRRLRHAAFLLCDIGWRRHPDYRAPGTYAEVLHMPFGGATHHERAFIAAAVFHRYAGNDSLPAFVDVTHLLDEDEAWRALQIGLTARLAFDLSASAIGELDHYRLKKTQTKLLLEVPEPRESVADESVLRRLGGLAGAMEREGEVWTTI